MSQIDDNFSIYKDNTVVLLARGNHTFQLIRLMRYHNIEIDYICDNKKENIGGFFLGVPVISAPQLKKLASENKQIVVQFADPNLSSSVISQVKSIGINNIISYDECHNILKCIFKMNLLKEGKLTFDENEYSVEYYASKLKENFTEYILNNYTNEQVVLICMPPKTGDNTLMKTFSNSGIPWLVMDHEPENLDKKLLKSLPGKVKIITAVREPIGQNLSFTYQFIAGFAKNCTGVGNNRNFKKIYNINSTDFFKYGGDVQTLFTKFYDYGSYNDNFGDTRNNIANFMNRFKENFLDISQYPFDKEKGYTIIKEDNIEILVFQLEKLNYIAKEVSDWIGTKPFSEWLNANEASDKWIAKSYKQAQKEITFSKEYFDFCYNNDWIKHFYSEKDIAKFKARWESHIK